MADDLAEVLGLLHDSDQRWRTLRAEGEPRGPRMFTLRGGGTQTRFDQRFWVEPLPPPGPLGVVVEWERRGLPETRADLDAGAIIEAASKAETLWS